MSHYRHLYYQARELVHTDPDTGMKLLEQATELAHEANDKRAVLDMNHWVLQELIFHTQDYGRAYELAIKTALEARKPAYSDDQNHICVQQDLIAVHLGMDPEGHASLIKDAIQYMDSQITRPINCRFCWHDLNTAFFIAARQLDKALEAALQFLSVSDNSWQRSHYGSVACSQVCEIAYLQGRWEDLLKYALQGEEWSRSAYRLDYNQCLFLACQALAYRKLGKEEEAHKQYRRAVMRAGRTKDMMKHSYYDVLCDFHLMSNNFKAALRLRDKQLESIKGKGQKYPESLCRLERCRLLQKMGKPIEAEAAETRAVIMTLKSPTRLLESLDDILAAKENNS